MTSVIQRLTLGRSKVVVRPLGSLATTLAFSAVAEGSS